MSDPIVIRRLDRTLPEHVWRSSITAEETLGDFLSQINKRREQSKGTDSELPSRLFVPSIERLRCATFYPDTNAAEEIYRAYAASVKRIGKMGRRLAAHVTVANFTVVTCTTADFRRIPGVSLEDWSRA